MRNQQQAGCGTVYLDACAFGQVAWAPRDRNECWHYAGCGAVYRGLLPGRDGDVVGLGVARAALVLEKVGDPEGGYETTAEALYKIEITPYFLIHLDFQYVVKPYARERDAFVAGMRWEVNF